MSKSIYYSIYHKIHRFHKLTNNNVLIKVLRNAHKLFRARF